MRDKKIKVLFLSYSFPPSQAPAALRIYYWVKYLDKNIFRPFVITPIISDSSLGYSRDLSLIDNENNIKVIRTKYLSRGINKLIRQNNNLSLSKTNSSIKSKIIKIGRSLLVPDKGISWIPFFIPLFFESYNFFKNIDVVITSSPLLTNHLIMLFIKRFIRKVKWIADIRDLIYSGVEMSEMSNFSSKILKLIEQETITRADAVIFVTESMKHFYQKIYNLNKKFYVIYNGFDDAEFSLLGNLTPPENEINIFYAGSFYEGKRDPFPLLEALNFLANKNQLRKKVNILIAGNLSYNLLKNILRFDKKPIINVVYLGILDRKKTLETMKKSHFLWLIVPDDLSHSIGIPTKTFEYIASGRYILAFTPQFAEVSSLLKEMKIGEIFELKRDQTAINRNAYKLSEIFFNSKKIYNTSWVLKKPELDKFSRHAQTKQLEKIIMSIL